MRWALLVTGVLGLGGVTFAIVAALTPEMVMPYTAYFLRVTPTASKITPLLAGAFASYSAWIMFGRGRLLPIRTTIDSTSNDDKAEARAGLSADTETSAETKESNSERPSITILGVDVIRFGASDGGSANEGSSRGSETAKLSEPSGYESTDERELAKDMTSFSIEPEVFDILRADPPEAAYKDSVSIVGAEFEDTVREKKNRLNNVMLHETDEHSSVALHPYDVEEVREQIRESIMSLEQRYGDRDAAALVTVLNDGSWTNDPVAAAFLSRDESVTLPLRERLRAWLFPDETLERAVNRTLDEIARMYGDQTGDRQ